MMTRNQLIQNVTDLFWAKLSQRSVLSVAQLVVAQLFGVCITVLLDYLLFEAPYSPDVPVRLR